MATATDVHARPACGASQQAGRTQLRKKSNGFVFAGLRLAVIGCDWRLLVTGCG